MNAIQKFFVALFLTAIILCIVLVLILGLMVYPVQTGVALFGVFTFTLVWENLE